MKTEQIVIKSTLKYSDFSFKPDLLLMFVSPQFKELDEIKKIRNKYPDAIIAGCSTSGEIEDVNVHDSTLSITAIKFDSSEVVYNQVEINSINDSYSIGSELINKFDFVGLKHVFVLSEGLNINGTELVNGLQNYDDDEISVTGGLAADGSDFGKTFVVTNSGEVKPNTVIALGFYGDLLKVGYGSLGGWDSFGVDRIVTKSEGNVVYEIDGEPILDFYKHILGSQSDKLPASALLFPLSVRESQNRKPVVRTVLKINETEKSLTFAGSIPEGSYVRLMKANIDRLINGAEGAAEVSIEPIGNIQTELAILVSCIGRRLVLKQLIEDEVEVVRDVVGDLATLTGFYSYGEIAPFLYSSRCKLHNQTMTITTFSELEN